jgi:hypothetical protein
MASHAARMIAEAEGRRARARADGDAAEAARCASKVDFWSRVREDVDQAPPLTPTLRAQLAVLLRTTSEPLPAGRAERRAA